jgi:hypothetical protein
MNHDPVYIAHPGVKRTYKLVALGYWWPSMRKSIADFVRKCDECQRRKEDRELIAPLGEVEEPTAHFQVTSMDITGPYLMTPRKNKYIRLSTISQNGPKVSRYQIKRQQHLPGCMLHKLLLDMAADPL